LFLSQKRLKGEKNKRDEDEGRNWKEKKESSLSSPPSPRPLSLGFLTLFFHIPSLFSIHST
jgi:hypothetical protein